MLRLTTQATLWAGAAPWAPAAWAQGRRPRVVVQPLTPAPKVVDLDVVQGAIAALLGAEVVLAPAIELPPSAYRAARDRYRAELLLEDLSSRRGDADAIVGVTAKDISTTKGDVADWGIMGLGLIGGGVCVSSRFRCAKGGARDAAHVRERLAKVCVHELGHALGSPHCDGAACLMNDARGRVKTVDAERTFCPSTLALFARRGFAVPPLPALPW